MSDTPPDWDDPLHPRRWKSNWHSDPDGPISGEDYATLKDLIASRMGEETERFSAVKPAEPVLPKPRSWLARLWPLRRY